MSRIIDKLAWLRIENKTLLAARTRNRDTYYLPGGKRDEGEDDHAALSREIREELNVYLIPETLLFVGQFAAPAHGQPAGTTVQMRCYTGDYTGNLAASAEIEEIRWLTYAERHEVSEVTQSIFDFLYARGDLR